MRYSLLLLPLVFGFSCAQKAPRAWGEPKLLCIVENERVKESSGIAASTREAGVYFTHNDSGSGPKFYKFNDKGKVLGEFAVSGAKATDWEEMASAKLDGKNFLYFADIGDNSRRRKSIQIYQAEEPKLGATAVPTVGTYDLSYPDEAQNAEAFFVHPKTGDFYIIPKASKTPVGLYRLERPARSGSYKLEKVADVKLSGSLSQALLITGAAISPDAKHVVVRTYLGAFEYDLVDTVASAFTRKPRAVRLNLELQGESITYRADGKALITTSEFSPCPVSVVPLKQP